MRDQGRPRHGSPILFRQEGGHHISQQTEPEPLQRLGVLFVRHADLEPDDRDGHKEKPQMIGQAEEHLQRRCHDPEIGSDVDGIGHDQKPHGEPQQAFGIMTLDHPGQTFPCHQADPAAHLLDGHHRGDQEEAHPIHPVAVPGAGYGVGGDAGGVVIGRAGDKPGPDLFQESARPLPKSHASIIR